MDAALKQVFPFRKTGNLDMAALQNSSSGYRNVPETSGTLLNHSLSPVKAIDETATKLRHFRESVRLASLVDDADGASFFDVDAVRFEIPVRIGGACGCLGESIVPRCERAQGDVLAEVRSKRGIEGGWIAFVQGDDLCDRACMVVRWMFLCKRESRASERQTAGD